jgi:hypothetical protein
MSIKGQPFKKQSFRLCNLFTAQALSFQHLIQIIQCIMNLFHPSSPPRFQLNPTRLNQTGKMFKTPVPDLLGIIREKTPGQFSHFQIIRDAFTAYSHVGIR